MPSLQSLATSTQSEVRAAPLAGGTAPKPQKMEKWSESELRLQDDRASPSRVYALWRCEG